MSPRPSALRYSLKAFRSEIQYDGESCKWGFQISNHGFKHQWFKLELDPSQRRNNSRLAKRFPDPTTTPPGYGVPAEKLVTDYLAALREHAEKVIRHKLPQSAVDETPMEFIVCSPHVMISFFLFWLIA